MQTDNIQVGRYRHYKGADYQVVGTARHSETEELLVLYIPLYGEGGFWVRPFSMFFEQVTLDSGQTVPRFEYIAA